MAHIYAGDLSRLDQEILEKVKELSDDYWAFAEFSVGRQIDWLIVRESAQGEPSTIILTELKRTTAPFRGASSDSPWQMQGLDGNWEPYRPSNDLDTNPYWQAVNTGNTAKTWLWNNQPLFRVGKELVAESEFGLWPDLLILSPPGVIHQLPMGPQSRFGRWWYRADAWLDHVRSWTPKKGIAIRHDDLTRLAVDVLRLQTIWPDGKPLPPPKPVTTGNQGLLEWAQGLESRLAYLEQRIAALEKR